MTSLRGLASASNYLSLYTSISSSTINLTNFPSQHQLQASPKDTFNIITMPPKQDTSSNSKGSAASESQPKDGSNNSFYKDGGWGNQKNFIESHGLKMHNDNDIQEAKAIRDAYREHDQRVWEEENRKK